MAIQTIRKAGVLPQYKKNYSYNRRVVNLEADVLSVDRNDIPYTLLRDALNYRCIDYYKYDFLIDELIGLEHDIKKGKVDHPATGSKDVSDALCGVVYSIATTKAFMEQLPTGEERDEQGRVGKSLEKMPRDTVSGTVSDYYGKVVDVQPPPVETYHHKTVNSGLHAFLRKNRNG